MRLQAIYKCFLGLMLFFSPLLGNTKEVDPLYLETDLVVLNVKCKGVLKEYILELSKEILEINADLVAIQDVPVEATHFLSEMLQEEYIDFLHTDSDEHSEYSRGMLIASKHLIEKSHFTYFSNSNEGFFDFIIRDKRQSPWRIYSPYFGMNCSSNMQVERLSHVVAHIEEEVLKEEWIPVLLCADLDSLQAAEGKKAFVNAYFRSEEASSLLSLCALPSFPNVEIAAEHKISSRLVSLRLAHSASLNLLQKERSYLIDDMYAKWERSSYEDKYSLYRGRVSASAEKDNDGNVSIETKISFSEELDAGCKVTADAKVEVTRDSDGHVSTKVKTEVGVDF